jgi:large subunit ribosomal protein L14e
MKVMDVGRVCYKTKGREAAYKAVIIDTHKGNHVTIVGPHLQKQKCNIQHLWPTEEVLKVKKGADQKEVVKLLK